MINELKQSYRGAARFALVCPILFVVPALVEFAQHVSEIHIGFYANMATMKAVEHHPMRMAIGHAKVLSLILGSYWVTRFLAFGDDPVAARRFDPVAVRLTLPLLAWTFAIIAIGLDGAAIGAALGIGNRPLAILGLALMPVIFVVGLGLYPWSCAVVLGNPAIGFGRSLRLSWGRYWWALAVSLGATIPLMAVHYALGFGAVGRSLLVVWLMMAVDAVVVACLGALLAASSYVIAAFITSEKDIELVPSGTNEMPLSTVSV